MRIKKIGQSTPVTGQIIDSLAGSSTTNAPSIRAVNEGLGALSEPVKLTNFTVNSKIGSALVYKLGRLVIVTFNIYVSEAIASNEVLVSGLPASKSYFAGSGKGANSFIFAPEIYTNSTAIKAQAAMPVGYYLGQLIYITAN